MSVYPKEFAKHFIGVGGVVIHNNKILLVKQKYGRSRGSFMIPGGFLDPGETLMEAVRREIKEETDADVEPCFVLSVRTMVREHDGLTDLYSIIKCKLLSSPNDIKPEAAEIEQVSWIPLNNCFNNPEISEYTKIIIRHALKESKDRLGLKPGKPISEGRKKRFSIKKYEEFWF